MLVKDVLKQLHHIHLEATNNRDMGAIREVRDRYHAILNQAPDDPNLLFSTATCEMQLGNNGASMAMFHRCLQINPELPEIWNNLGSAYKAENMDEEAEKCWLKALELKEATDYLNNMVTLYVNTGMPEKGMKWAERGLELDPNHARLNWNYSLLLLEQGRWAEGFQHYEYGKESMDRPKRAYSKDPDAIPWWSGEPGKVVIYGEQGMGDEIMYASAIPDLIERVGAKNVIFDCHPRMKSLWKRTFPNIKLYDTRKSNDVSWAKHERIDYRCAMGELFKIFRSDGVFPKLPYLKADPKLVKKYRKRLAEAGPGPYVGVAWLAGSKGTRTEFRSVKLGHLRPLFECGGTFVSLQYTDGAQGKCDRFYKDSGIKVHHWKEVVEANTGDLDKDGNSIRTIGFNYDHSVALIEALDLVIAPNTTAVHVCGALGKECWSITPKEAAWRYQLSGKHMPMYGDWVTLYRGGAALERITEEYKRRVSGSWSEPNQAAIGR